MDPLTERFDKKPPRDLSQDAHFAGDRGTPVTRTVNVLRIGGNAAPVATAFPGFKSRFTVGGTRRPNPLPHQRMTDAEPHVIDTAAARFREFVVYSWVRSDSAAVLAAPPPAGPNPPPQPRLRVSVLFGVGSEMHRHGIAAVAARATRPSLLILVDGVEPSHKKKFQRPDGGEVELVANNRWGHGITDSTVKDIIAIEFGRAVLYDIVVLAAFSTGHYGLGGTLRKRTLDFSALERVVVYDCLYRHLGGGFDLLASRNPAAKVIAYVASPGGNDFRGGEANKNPKFTDLLLGGKPGWQYIDLYYSHPSYPAAPAARVVNEGRTSGSPPIISVLPEAYTNALDAMVAALPPRFTLISDAAVFQRIRGAPPSGAVSLADLDKSHGKELATFNKQLVTTRRCISNGQLLGWAPGPGEEQHDLLLVDFAWEYLV